MSDAAQKLMDLEAAGFVFSRNRNFDGYSDPKNQDALVLKKRLANLQALIRDHIGDELAVEVEQRDSHIVVHLSLPRLSARYLTYLSPDELVIFARDDVVAGVLRDAGVELPA